MPKRIQRKRTKGWRMPKNTVYVGRPSRWGNPTKTAIGFRRWLDGTNPCWNEKEDLNVTEARRHWILQNIHLLIDKDLACWCPLDKPCHAHKLLEEAEEMEEYQED